MNVIRFLFTR